MQIQMQRWKRRGCAGVRVVPVCDKQAWRTRQCCLDRSRHTLTQIQILSPANQIFPVITELPRHSHPFRRQTHHRRWESGVAVL